MSCLPRKNLTVFKEVKERFLSSGTHNIHYRTPNERERTIMAIIKVTFPSDGPPGKILKWRVRLDTMVAAGRILLLYQDVAMTGIENESAKETERKLRATTFGRVKQILAKEGDVIQPGYDIYIYIYSHLTILIRFAYLSIYIY